MTAPLYAIGRFCSRHQYPVLAAWIVLAILLPAVMVLLGKRVWWLPRWLDRGLPRISIEGEEFFARRDAEAASEPSPAAAGSR